MYLFVLHAGSSECGIKEEKSDIVVGLVTALFRLINHIVITKTL
jgi:hypothetical protein